MQSEYQSGKKSGKKSGFPPWSRIPASFAFSAGHFTSKEVRHGEICENIDKSGIYEMDEDIYHPKRDGRKGSDLLVQEKT